MLLLALALTFLGATLRAEELPLKPAPSVLKADGIAATRDFPDGDLWAIGDVHADVYALKDILIQINLIDKTGQWIGGKSGLVINGDFSAKGNHTRAIWDLLMRLEKEAQAAGGFVETLLGNHEIMIIQGRSEFISEADTVAFSEFDQHQATRQSVVNAATGETVYAQWLAQKNTLVKIGSVLFVHAGIGPWIQDFTLEEVNSTVRGRIKYRQNRGSDPGEATRWVVADAGPLFTPAFTTKKKAMGGDLAPPDPKEAEKWVDHTGSDYAVLAHVVTPNAQIMTEHPRLGKKFKSIDTAIGITEGGNLSALQVLPDHQDPIAFEFPRLSRTCGAVFENPPNNTDAATKKGAF